VLTEVRLYGALGIQFGRVRHLDVSSPREAVRALCATVPGFRKHLVQEERQRYRILVGGPGGADVPPVAQQVGLEDLAVPTSREVIRIVPVLAGAKDAWVTAVIGIALVAVSYGGGLAYLGASASVVSAVGSIGLAMAIGGISQLLASPPTLNPTGIGGEARDRNYLFAGPANTISQGGPVPVGFGRLRVGGVPISGGIVPETPKNQGQFGAHGDGLGTITGDGDTTPWTGSVAVD
jgi:predicted phage tail protein